MKNEHKEVFVKIMDDTGGSRMALIFFKKIKLIILCLILTFSISAESKLLIKPICPNQITGLVTSVTNPVDPLVKPVKYEIKFIKNSTNMKNQNEILKFLSRLDLKEGQKFKIGYTRDLICGISFLK